MTTYNITVSKDCIGCGACTVTSDNFAMSENGKAYPIETEVTELKQNKEAEDVCPIGAIKIKKVTT